MAARFRGITEANTGHRWPCQGQVILHRAAVEVAPYLAEGAVEALGPDRCRLTMGTWSWAGLAASIAQTGADIEVITPPELAHAFADLARRAHAAARSTTTSGTTTPHLT